ncbi:MAG: amidophosphoribosyltransferase [Candidatus Marinimicrobia bacterium]|nr:amidophosphoribosyltransferase [Candidatus Neomarinimicrobiota bacterium]MDD5582133.1 amidophosphoribosyltransferase [Candidatus Neomarinimicrobiota bacterium]
MCGIIGIIGREDISEELINGLTVIQHRGQDAAGIVTLNSRFRMKKGQGHVDKVFQNFDIEQFRGKCGLGHVRYATMGSTLEVDAQPIAVNYPYGLAMVHNGNVINFKEVRQRLYDENMRLLDTSNDVALILYTFAAQLEKKDLKHLHVDDIFDVVLDVQNLIKGAYSALTIIANKGFLAFTDPYGIRPLVMGRKLTDQGVVYAFASETVVFDYLGYEMVRDLQAGEAIFIDNEMNVHSKILKQEKQAFCVFEYIYFAREDSVFHHRLVASERVKMGKKLAKSFKEAHIDPDIIIDVPSSAYFFASGLAEEVKIPYRRGLAKNQFVGRSFITPTQKERENVVKQKLNPIKDIIKGRKVAVVDDSIVRGTTSRHIIHLLQEYGADKVYFISASPPIKFPCIYGIDMSVRKEMVASHYDDPQEIARVIGADAVVYQKLEDLQELYHDLPICDACFSGNYPTGITPDILKHIELEKINSDRN